MNVRLPADAAVPVKVTWTLPSMSMSFAATPVRTVVNAPSTTVGALQVRAVPGGMGGSWARTVGVPLSVNPAGIVTRTQPMAVCPGLKLTLLNVTVKLVGVPATAVVGLIVAVLTWTAATGIGPARAATSAPTWRATRASRRADVPDRRWCIS